MSKKFWIIAVVIILALIGIFALTGNKSKNTGANVAKATLHIEGQGKDGVTLIEYGDYQCPYCGEYYPTVKEVAQMYNQQIFFQFRNFPLTSIHQNAFAGARAAEAAGLMGQFWQMHDLLYEQNIQYYNSNGAYAGWIGASNPETVFEQDAKSLGLNVQTFDQLYNSEQVNNLINADEAAGNAKGLDATPTFILDGKQIQVGNSVQSFETLINQAIAQKTGASSAPASTSAGTTQQTKK